MWVKFTGAGEPMKHLAGATQILLWRRSDNFAVIGFTSTVTDDGRDHGRNEDFDLWQAIAPPCDMASGAAVALSQYAHQRDEAGGNIHPADL